MKTDRTVLMVKLIRVFAGRKGHFVGFVLWLIYLTISLLADIAEEPNSKFKGSLSFESRVWHPCELK